MEKMDSYKVDLLQSSFKGDSLLFDLDDDFFATIDGLIDRGTIATTVNCKNTGSMYKFQIHSEGTIIVPCDRCLSDLELRIDTTDELTVKLGDDYSDEGDCVIVPESEGYIDLAHFIYEFIVLSMPITCTHEPGRCDDTMMQKLSMHQAVRSSQEDDEDSDSGNKKLSDAKMVDDRWSALLKLKDQDGKDE